MSNTPQQLDLFNAQRNWGDWSEGSYSSKFRSWKTRVVVWFSCGATSAIAAKLALMRYGGTLPVEIMYFDTGGEHESNHIFLRQCEEWLNHPIRVLKNEKYKDHFDVFEKRRFIASPYGAPCTTVLKREMRVRHSDPITDIQVFGYDPEERRRVDNFRSRNEDVYLKYRC